MKRPDEAGAAVPAKASLISNGLVMVWALSASIKNVSARAASLAAAMGTSATKAVPRILALMWSLSCWAAWLCAPAFYTSGAVSART